VTPAAMVQCGNPWYDAKSLGGRIDWMDAGLTRLSDTELTALHTRIAQAMISANAELRERAALQLEAIALERERRLSPAAGEDHR
jgi:hypothetical protein